MDRDPEDLGGSRSGRGLWLVLAALLLAAAAVFTGLNLMRYFTVEEVRLPDLVDADGIKAEHLNGVLTVSIPKKAEVKPAVKEISIG